MNLFPPEEKPLRDLLARLLPHFIADERITAVWAEGEPDGRRTRLSEPLDLHVAIPEPRFTEIADEIPALIGKAVEIESTTSGPADFEGRTHTITTKSGPTIRVTVERTALVGKRPRKAILPQHDRSGLLRYAMDLSLRKH